jgi:hypothetical protein
MHRQPSLRLRADLAFSASSGCIMGADVVVIIVGLATGRTSFFIHSDDDLQKILCCYLKRSGISGARQLNQRRQTIIFRLSGVVLRPLLNAFSAGRRAATARQRGAQSLARRAGTSYVCAAGTNIFAIREQPTLVWLGALVAATFPRIDGLNARHAAPL